MIKRDEMKVGYCVLKCEKALSRCRKQRTKRLREAGFIQQAFIELFEPMYIKKLKTPNLK